ncbi:unnamed protein product [Rhizoctonia solani]|uniref:Uncharacterized protein n=1 Tax=Rhizoctonia solani TaxID=456999 RepID=A0A8H3HH79_9AGAM|nr:unnamed protein product [Rhizoctonia solani]
MSAAPSVSSNAQPATLNKTLLAMEDLVMGEHVLVSQLDRLVNHYLRHLPYVSSEAQISMFLRSACSLLELHTLIESQLRVCQRDRSSMCRVLVLHTARLTTLHSEFYSHYLLAKAVIDREQAHAPQTWAAWRKDRVNKSPPEEDGSRPRSLEALMIAPIQRVFRYFGIISAFRDGTNVSEVENAVLVMQTIATSIDKTACVHEKLQWTGLAASPEHIDPIPGQKPGFLATLGPCILAGSLRVTYSTSVVSKPLSIATDISVAHSKSVVPSANSALPSRRLPCVHNSLGHCSEIAHSRNLIVFLWKGYLLLCEPPVKGVRLTPKHWFSLKPDATVLANNDIFPFGVRVTFGLNVLRLTPKHWFSLKPDATVLANNDIFPFGVRVTFGLNVLDLGLACVDERDTWLDYISSSRVSLEEGQVIDMRAYSPKNSFRIRRPRTAPEQPVKKDTKQRKGLTRTRSHGYLRPREDELETTPAPEQPVKKDTKQRKGLTRTRSHGYLRPREDELETIPIATYLGSTSISQAVSSLESTTRKDETDGRHVGREDHHDRRAAVTHSSNVSIFRQLIAKGCIDLSLSLDPRGYSLRPMAGGGLADIWRGQLLNGTRVAVKVWRDIRLEEDDPKQLKRAMREVYNWSKLVHQNVHQLMGVVMFQGRLGMVSEWMEYGSLREYAKHHACVDRFPLYIQVATGLSYIHDNDMVHGDLKAGNVLVSKDGVIKLSDFGHSVLSECTLVFSETTDLGGGTLRWMAPELLATPNIESGPPKRNKQTDIYALGMTFLVRNMRTETFVF